MKQSLYLETSVIGAYLDNGEPFRRDLTIRWWEHELFEYQPFVSLLVQRELERRPHAAQVVREPGERALALALLEFGTVVAAVGDELEPHRLCGYLFELAQTFSSFYENHPVLKAEDSELRESRLALCALTVRVLVQGLDLLGLESPEQM